MKFALIVIVKPITEKRAEIEKWNNFVETLSQKVSSVEGIEMLSENVMQIPLENGLLLFAEVVRTCNLDSYQCKVLFFDEDPKWITS
ncbi:MAG: hypothetical protein FD174_1236 [Geobacteraceae bacterium]|nr:MAG: hypothetical protein FD174_1236 [Geobacteraceae bacterium]